MCLSSHLVPNLGCWLMHTGPAEGTVTWLTAYLVWLVIPALGICVPEFIPCMDKLFDESILIGSGYTARETLRYDSKPVISCLLHAGASGSWHLL